MIEVWYYAPSGIVERKDAVAAAGAVAIDIRVEATQGTSRDFQASESIDALVIAFAAASSAIPVKIEEFRRVIRGAGGVGQRPKIVIEGMVFLHNHDNVIHFLQAGLGKGRLRSNRQKR